MDYKSLERIKREKNYYFLNVTPETDPPVYARVGVTEAWTDEMNPVEDTFNFIQDAGATTEITGYNVRASFPYKTFIGDPAYDYFFSLYAKRATGEEVVSDTVRVFQQVADNGEHVALKSLVSVVLRNYNFASGEINVDIVNRGDPVVGTASINASANEGHGDFLSFTPEDE
jgi:hypothetical protein